MVEKVAISQIRRGDIIMINVENKDEPIILTVDKVNVGELRIYPNQLEPALISFQPFGDIIRLKQFSDSIKKVVTKLDLRIIGTVIDLKLR